MQHYTNTLRRAHGEINNMGLGRPLSADGRIRGLGVRKPYVITIVAVCWYGEKPRQGPTDNWPTLA